MHNGWWLMLRAGQALAGPLHAAQASSGWLGGWVLRASIQEETESQTNKHKRNLYRSMT